MGATHIPQIRALLRANSDGLTSRELRACTGQSASSVHSTLRFMPDVYIDRWVKYSRGYAAVWCVVVPPADCPRPGR